MVGKLIKIIKPVAEDRSWWLHPYAVAFYVLGVVMLIIKNVQWAFGL